MYLFYFCLLSNKVLKAKVLLTPCCTPKPSYLSCQSSEITCYKKPPDSKTLLDILHLCPSQFFACLTIIFNLYYNDLSICVLSRHFSTEASTRFYSFSYLKHCHIYIINLSITLN